MRTKVWRTVSWLGVAVAGTAALLCSWPGRTTSNRRFAAIAPPEAMVPATRPPELTEEQLLEITHKALESQDPPGTFVALLRPFRPDVAGVRKPSYEELPWLRSHEGFREDYLYSVTRVALEKYYPPAEVEKVVRLIYGYLSRAESRPEMLEKAKQEGLIDPPPDSAGIGMSVPLQADAAVGAIFLFAFGTPNYSWKELADRALQEIGAAVQAKDYTGAKSLWGAVLMLPLKKVVDQGDKESALELLERMAALAVDESKFPFPEQWVPAQEAGKMLEEIGEAKGAEFLERLHEAGVGAGGDRHEAGREESVHHAWHGVWGDLSALWWQLKSKVLSPEQLTGLLAKCREAMPDYSDRSWRRLALLNLEAAADVIGPACLPEMRRIAAEPSFLWFTVRKDAIDALGRLNDPQAPPLLRSIIADGSEEAYARSRAARAVGYFGEQLGDRSPSGREGFEVLLRLFREGVEKKDAALLAAAPCCLMMTYSEMGITLPKEYEEFLRQIAAAGDTTTAETLSERAKRILDMFSPREVEESSHSNKQEP